MIDNPYDDTPGAEACSVIVTTGSDPGVRLYFALK